MTITAVFENLNEVKEFAEMFRGRKGATGEEAAGKQPETPAAAPVIAAAPQAAEAPAAPATQNSMPAAQHPAPTRPTGAVPVTAVQYTLDDLARAAITLMDTGRQADLQGLLARFGVEALPMLPKEQYGAFATALREMGAQI